MIIKKKSSWIWDGVRETQEDLEGGERRMGRNDVAALLCKILKKNLKS